MHMFSTLVMYILYTYVHHTALEKQRKYFEVSSEEKGIYCSLYEWSKPVPVHTAKARNNTNYLELPRQHSSCVDVGGVGLNGFIVAQDLSRRCRGHGGHQKTVPHSVPGEQVVSISI